MTVIVDEGMVERAARALAQANGRNPDDPVYYEPPGYRRDPIKLDMIGARRSDGSVVAQYPSMPLWQWEYRRAAELALVAALRNAKWGDGRRG